ncbi:hypothetical protein LGH83_12855 [Lichenihabitans sp. PAMC28606]|uniref:hypothetical protein n=1 Tax=Lichenihabitans sp. PAMC28606 TaxID=2880932 RepID=UPI001D09C6E9|nr:hypothetical protein [Lichenihabitans sp. PAMC28606]UDL93474.1 hypothetical protein LGH83_12855 [Lichenihabitans sp. PAMC28606]
MLDPSLDLPTPWALINTVPRYRRESGVACVAILAGISDREARRSLFGMDATAIPDVHKIGLALRYHGLRLAPDMTPFWEADYRDLPRHALLALDPWTPRTCATGLWPWAVWDANRKRILGPRKRLRPMVVGHLTVERVS